MHLVWHVVPRAVAYLDEDRPGACTWPFQSMGASRREQDVWVNGGPYFALAMLGGGPELS